MLPIPAELPLSIPIWVPLAQFLLVVSFLIHIVFALVTVSGATLALQQQFLGLKTKDPRHERLARELIHTVSFNKSWAVVVGIAPLLLISVLYTSFFYPATVINGAAWLSVIPILIVGFLLLYAYKFGWDSLSKHRGFHMALGILGTLSLYIVPMIFITTMGLMKYPDHWLTTSSIFQIINYPTMIIRYLHFIVATVIFGGLLTMAIGWWQSRKPLDDQTDADYYQWVQTTGGKIALYAILVQFIFGITTLFALPSSVMNKFLGGNLISTVILALAFLSALTALFFLWGQRTSAKQIFVKTTSLLMISLCLMALVRYQVRDYYLEPVKAQAAIDQENKKQQNAQKALEREQAAAVAASSQGAATSADSQSVAAPADSQGATTPAMKQEGAPSKQ